MSQHCSSCHSPLLILYPICTQSRILDRLVFTIQCTRIWQIFIEIITRSVPLNVRIYILLYFGGFTYLTIVKLISKAIGADCWSCAAVPGGMMGMGGVVAMRRNADLHSDYAFAVDTGRGPGHPD